MKALILLLSLPFLSYSQETVEVYEYTNGIKNITPKQVIVVKEEQVEIYNTTFGIQDISPTKVIDKEGNIFNVTNSVQDILPAEKIEIKDGANSIYH